MIKGTYLFLRCMIIIIITAAVIIVALATRPETLQYVGVKLIKANGVEYSKIEGSLLDGFTVHDVNYADAVLIKTLKINYNLAMLLNPTPIIKKIRVDGLTVISKNLPSSEKNDNKLSIIPFSISKLQL
nr:hypothetical protein [Sulfurimonas sp.]